MRASADGDTVRTRRLMVVGEVALSLALLVAAGLFIESLVNVYEVEPGIEPDRILSFSIDLAHLRQPWDEGLRFVLDLQDRINQEPGVLGATASARALLSGDRIQNTIGVEGYTPAPGVPMQAGWNIVLPRFHSALGIRLLAGRDFSPADTEDSPLVAIVNRHFAERFFGSPANAVGRRIGWGGELNQEIVGVVENFRSVDLKDDDLLDRTINPYAQGHLTGSGFQFYVRTANDPTSHAAAVREIVAEMNPSVVVADVQALDRQVAITHSRDVVMARLSTAFAALATLLAVGLYGITAISVARRNREIGIRIALGAKRSNILGLVAREIAALLLMGVVSGAVLALVLWSMVQNQLFGVDAIAGWIVLWAATALTFVGFLAGAVPAWRAIRIQPTDVLGSE